MWRGEIQRLIDMRYLGYLDAAGAILESCVCDAAH